MFIDINNNFMLRPQNHQATASGSSHHDHPNPNWSQVCPFGNCQEKEKDRWIYKTKEKYRAHIKDPTSHIDDDVTVDDKLAVLRRTYKNDPSFEQQNKDMLAEYRARYLVQ
jgi:hypothetical protein